MVDLGTTDRGDPVLMNKYVYDSDVAILIGHTQGNPYGGYSGGYKHCSMCWPISSNLVRIREWPFTGVKSFRCIT